VSLFDLSPTSGVFKTFDETLNGAETRLAFKGKVYIRMQSKEVGVSDAAALSFPMRARGDGSTAPSPRPEGEPSVDGGPMPLAPTAAHDPAPGGSRAIGEGAGEAEVPRRERPRSTKNARLGTNGVLTMCAF